jgi:hypothetical protein
MTFQTSPLPKYTTAAVSNALKNIASVYPDFVAACIAGDKNRVREISSRGEETFKKVKRPFLLKDFYSLR